MQWVILPALRPPDNFRASGAQTAAVPQVSTLELLPYLRATLRFKDPLLSCVTNTQQNTHHGRPS
jgi:hypothetical protein